MKCDLCNSHMVELDENKYDEDGDEYKVNVCGNCGNAIYTLFRTVEEGT